MVKALLAELWLEENQRTFQDKELGWLGHFDSAARNTFAWCSLSKDFEVYSIQELCLNWRAFIFPNS